MGVSWVLSTNESAQSFEIALERMGAKHNGTFKVDCTVYKPTLPVSGQIGQFFLLHHSNFPDSACCFGDPFASNPTQDAPMARATTDLGFELIMQKFTASLVPDQLQRFEVNGAEYHLKDFRVRVGTALVGTSTKGTVVEFEFAPCAVVMQCIQMLSEFVMTFFPNESSSRHTALKLPGPLYRQRSSPDNYRVSDTLEQYLWVFAEMRKKIP